MPESSDQSSRDSQKSEETRIGFRMAGIGFTVASEVAAGTLLGWLFDRWRGTGNVGVLVGALVGIAVGLWSLIRNSLRLNRELDRKAPTKGRGTPIPADEPWTEPDPDDDDSTNPDDDDAAPRHTG
jgi:F0F1-type ATP synthase assembly protein I